MEILVRNQAVINILNQIADVIHSHYPDDYEAFIKYVILESQHLVKPSGLSPEGHIMNFMKIPCVTNKAGEKINLYGAIKRLMRKYCGIEDFFSDRKNYELLCQTWKDAYVKKRPTRHIEVGVSFGESKSDQ